MYYQLCISFFFAIIITFKIVLGWLSISISHKRYSYFFLAISNIALQSLGQDVRLSGVFKTLHCDYLGVNLSRFTDIDSCVVQWDVWFRARNYEIATFERKSLECGVCV